MEENINILIETVKSSVSINEVFIKLGLNTSSGNYKKFNKLKIKYNIDISHFLSRSDLMKLKFKNREKSIDEVFTINSFYGRNVIKQRIIKDKLIEYKCCICHNDGFWFNKKLTLILDHINGVNNDNRLENLRFVCPNCNSQLSTHCVGSYVKKEKVKRIKKGKTINLKNRKVKDRPSLDVLISDIQNLGYCGTGRKYGVSDNAIRKWIS